MEGYTDLLSTYTDIITEEIRAKRKKVNDEKLFSIPEDTILFYRDENKTTVGEV